MAGTDNIILLGSYYNLDVQLGAEFDMDYGEINLK